MEEKSEFTRYIWSINSLHSRRGSSRSNCWLHRSRLSRTRRLNWIHPRSLNSWIIHWHETSGWWGRSQDMRHLLPSSWANLRCVSTISRNSRRTSLITRVSSSLNSWFKANSELWSNHKTKISEERVHTGYNWEPKVDGCWYCSTFLNIGGFAGTNFTGAWVLTGGGGKLPCKFKTCIMIQLMVLP